MGRKKRQPQEFTEEEKEYLKQYKENISFSKTTTINNNEINNGCISKRKIVDYNDNEVQYDKDFELHTASDSMQHFTFTCFYNFIIWFQFSSILRHCVSNGTKMILQVKTFSFYKS